MQKIKLYVKRNTKPMILGAGVLLALMCIPKVGSWVDTATTAVRTKLGGVA